MRLGVGTYSYGWSSGTFQNDVTRSSQSAGFKNLSAYDHIDRAVHFDVPVVQLAVLPDLSAMNDAQLASIREHAESNGRELEIGTVGCNPQHLLAYLSIAEKLNAGLIRTILTTASPGLAAETANLASVADQFEAAGIYLALENYESASFHEFARICRTVNNEFVGITLDTVNNLGLGEGVEEVTTNLIPYTKCFHVKDFTVKRAASNASFTVSGAPAGEGRLDLVKHLSMLKEVHPNASVILEQWTPFQGTLQATAGLEMEWAEISIRNMKSALAAVEG